MSEMSRKRYELQTTEQYGYPNGAWSSWKTPVPPNDTWQLVAAVRKGETFYFFWQREVEEY